MKFLTLLLPLAILTSCSWRQRDFERELKDAPTTSPQVEVSNKELLEKFETKPIESEPAKTPAPAQVVQKAPTRIVEKVETKVINAPVKKVVTTTIKQEVKTLPADYPNELLETNAKAKKVWDLYRPNHQEGEKVFLDIYYMGMTVGKIMVENKGKEVMNGREVWHFHSRFKSAPFYSSIYELDDTVDTYVDTNQFLSMKYTLIQRESKQNIDDLQLFDRDQMKLYWFYKRENAKKKIRNKEGENYIPYFSIDPFSVLYLFQGLPLGDNDVYEIPVVNKDKLMILKAKVEGRETLKTDIGRRKAIKLHATTQYTGQTLKSGDMTFWFSDDEKRTLLRAKAKIKLGSVTAEIVKE